jgi:regulator of PEP synthase PpsR (kinase-PPPase family)
VLFLRFYLSGAMGPTKKTVPKSTSAPFSSQQQKEKQHNTHAVAAAAALPATSSTEKDTRAAVVHYTTAALTEEPWMTRFTMSNFMELH